MNVRENDRVQAVGGFHDGKVGTVKTVYDIVDMAIVDFDDGTVGKVSLDRLVKIKSQENQEAKSETPEIPEGAKQITKVEFVDALRKITSPEAIFSNKSVNPIHALTEGLSAILFGHKAAKIIFEDDDVAILTEDDLVGALWDACDPAVMCEEADCKQSAFAGLLMSVSAVIILRDLVTILFGEPDND